MAIQKLNLEEVDNPGEAILKAFSILNQLVDAVNELQATISKKEKVETRPENVQPDCVTTSYMADGRTKEFYGQNGASIVTDHPLPVGYVITIREPETKGGDNE